jgi:folate-binding protein YgfZ
MTENYLKLPYTLIKISGPDAAKFLQGQFSCDVEALEDNSWSYGTANTPKGRMYWLFVIARIDGDFWIRVHKDIADAGIAVLSKYKVFFKCEITVQSEFSVYGTKEICDVNSRSIELNEQGFRRAADSSGSRCELWSKTSSESSSSEKDLELWLKEDASQGIPELYPETTDTFILQQLNLQDLGAVSFKKGCYTGQEIIARMKFLGKLKKKMYHFTVNSDAHQKALPGSNIVDSEGKKVGQLVRVHSHNNTMSGLLVCDMAFIEQSTPAFLDEISGLPLTITELHYN